MIQKKGIKMKKIYRLLSVILVLLISLSICFFRSYALRDIVSVNETLTKIMFVYQKVGTSEKYKPTIEQYTLNLEGTSVLQENEMVNNLTQSKYRLSIWNYMYGHSGKNIKNVEFGDEIVYVYFWNKAGSQSILTLSDKNVAWVIDNEGKHYKMYPVSKELFATVSSYIRNEGVIE